MILHEKSHVDHAISPDQWAHIIALFQDRGAFFIETIELPPHLGTVMNGLYGPSCGDAPVPESEVYYAKRGDRAWDSRMTKMPPRPTRFVRVIAGPHKEECATCKGSGITCFRPAENGEPALNEHTCTKCGGFGGTMFDCVLYTAYGVSSPDMPAAPKEPGDIEAQLVTLRKKMGELSTKLNDANFADRDDEDTVGAELVECTKQNEKLWKDIETSRAFWAQHALAVEVG